MFYWIIHGWVLSDKEWQLSLLRRKAMLLWHRQRDFCLIPGQKVLTRFGKSFQLLFNTYRLAGVCHRQLFDGPPSQGIAFSLRRKQSQLFALLIGQWVTVPDLWTKERNCRDSVKCARAPLFNFKVNKSKRVFAPKAPRAVKSMVNREWMAVLSGVMLWIRFSFLLIHD